MENNPDNNNETDNQSKHRKWIVFYSIIAVLAFCNTAACVGMVEWMAYDKIGYETLINPIKSIFNYQLDWAFTFTIAGAISVVIIVFSIIKIVKHTKIIHPNY